MASADGENFLVGLSPSATADLPAGAYRWNSFFELGSPATERWKDRSGVLELLPDLTHAPANSQLIEEKMVAAIQAVLSGRITADLEQYTIDGRAVTKISFPELNKQLGIWKARLWRKLNAGQSFPQHAVRWNAVR